MIYFGMSKKEGRGCPIGLINMVLYDSFHDANEAKKIKHGFYPWYANKSAGQPHEKYPDGLCLIAKVPFIDFDIRGHSQFFHIVSQDFYNLMQELGCEYEDAKPIKVCSTKGQPISTKEYYVVTFKKYKLSDIMDMSEAELFPRKIGDISDRIKKFKFKSDFNKQIFQIEKLSPGHDTVFCSEQFKTLAEQRGFKGVDFLPVEGNASGSFSQI